MNVRGAWIAITLAALAIIGSAWLLGPRSSHQDITVVISPYQDLAMLVNVKPLGLEKKYGTTINLRTIPWEETYTAVLSAAGDVDVGFASFADYLTKVSNLNRNSSDPLLFIYPAYIFKGGAFVSFKSDVPALSPADLREPESLRRFLRYRIGLQKFSRDQMMIYHLATLAGIKPETVQIVDIGFDAGLLAAEQGDLDIAAVGLTQLTEAKRNGGRVVFDMNAMGFADITGFICRKSVLDRKRHHIQNLIRMWFDAVDFVLSDIDRNSAHSLEYLAQNAATRYSVETYKTALSQEHFPRSVEEANKEIVQDDGEYAEKNIYEIMSKFLIEQGIVKQSLERPLFISLGK